MKVRRTLVMGYVVSTACAMLLAAAAADALVMPSASPAVERRAFAEKIMASTNMEWSSYFTSRGRIYMAPRSIFMQLPNGHPARGFGYHRRVGVNVELSEMIDLQAAQPVSADLITALIIAHEVAHHVQSELEKAEKDHPLASMDRELEADCAAGWWLAKANARSLMATGKPLLVVLDIAVELPRALNLLSGAKEGLPVRIVGTHGGVGSRIAAIHMGMRSPTIENCGAGFQI